MGAFDFKGQFPTAALIEAAIQRRKQENDARQRQQELAQAQTQQTIQNAGAAAGALNKYSMNKQMSQTLAGSPAVQSYMGHQANPAVAQAPMGSPTGLPINLTDTARGGVGVLPQTNAPRKFDPKLIQPFVDAGKGDELLKNAADMQYKNSTVQDIIPTKDVAGNMSFQTVTRQRGGKTLAPTNPLRPLAPPRPAATGGRGQTRAQLTNIAVDNAMARIKAEYPFGAEQAKSAGVDFELLRQKYIEEEFARLDSEKEGGAGKVPANERAKFIQGAVARGYSQQEAEQLANKGGL